MLYTHTPQVLVCASCHRFVGSEATQLAMVDGLPRVNPGHAAAVATTSTDVTPKKRRLSGRGGGDRSTGVVDMQARLAPKNGRSQRAAIADAQPSQLPDLPMLGSEESPGVNKLSSTANGEHEGGDGSGESAAAARRVSDPPGVSAGCAPSREGLTANGGIDGLGGAGKRRRKGGGGYPCERGAPCDDMYCSVGCREAALAAGHGLICFGGTEEGRFVPLSRVGCHFCVLLAALFLCNLHCNFTTVLLPPVAPQIEWNDVYDRLCNRGGCRRARNR